MKKIFYVFICSLVLAACSDDSGFVFNSETKDVNIMFSNVINSEQVDLTGKIYQNSEGENFSIRELKYIISNIELVMENGAVYTYPIEDSYFLINQEDASSRFLTLKNIPIEDFKTLKFGIGVDQSNYPLNGVDNFVPTAEENQMLWSWSAGYIFFKIEGAYQVSNEATEEDFLFHIGSHGTNLDNYKTVELTSTQSDLDLTSKDLIAIEADISKLFNAVHDIRINDKSDIQVDPVNAPKIADNVSQMFALKSTLTTN
jgi:hypothetical protein